MGGGVTQLSFLMRTKLRISKVPLGLANQYITSHWLFPQPLFPYRAVLLNKPIRMRVKYEWFILSPLLAYCLQAESFLLQL